MSKENLELPEPHEKLLRSPTFAEKYPWIKSTALIVLLMLTMLLGMYYVLDKETQTIKGQELETVKPTAVAIKSSWMDEDMSSWQSYTSVQGKYTIKYPVDFILNPDTGSGNTIQLLSPVIPEIQTNFRVSITHKNPAGSNSLKTLIDRNPICDGINSNAGTSGVINGEKPAQLYIDTPCGQYEQTVVYSLLNNVLYIISIESTAKFANIKQYADKIISTLEFYERSPTVPVATPTPTSAPIDTSRSSEGVLCTQDAKQCPDGSWVGRSGPNCEFVCPAN